jgi:hypothetical protein
MLGDVDITGFTIPFPGLGPNPIRITRVSIPFSQPTGNLCVFNQVGIGSVAPIKIAAATGSLVVNYGNVGFGTLYPEAGLHIEKGATNDVALMLSSTGPGWGSGIQFKNNDLLYGIYAGSGSFHIVDNKRQGDILNIDANGNLTNNGSLTNNGNLVVSGNVGIGTTNPINKLQVEGNLHMDGNSIFLRQNPGDQFDFIKWNSSLDRVDIGGFNGVNLGYTNGTGGGYVEPALSVDAVGNVGIGTLNPLAKFDVKGNINISGNVNVQATLNAGNINVDGDVILMGADCAEDFDIVDAESVEPGTVMVIDNDGALRASEQAYDKRVAGVISGAGNLRPGIHLDKQTNKANRLPIALTGKVYCKVDAKYNSIEVGDLLTTSSTVGHAMKVSDHIRSIGAIIGKALRPLEAEQDIIPILVALQ